MIDRDPANDFAHQLSLARVRVFTERDQRSRLVPTRDTRPSILTYLLVEGMILAGGAWALFGLVTLVMHRLHAG